MMMAEVVMIKMIVTYDDDEGDCRKQLPPQSSAASKYELSAVILSSVTLKSLEMMMIMMIVVMIILTIMIVMIMRIVI